MIRPSRQDRHGGPPAYSAGLADDPSSSSTPTLIGLRARWALVPPGWRAVAIVVGAVVIVSALVQLTSAVTEGSVPQGPQSSSFSPAPEGLAAYAQLLSSNGVRVQQVVSQLGQVDIPSSATVVIAAPTTWRTSNSTALAKLLRAGARVIVAGQPPAGLLEALGLVRAPTWSAVPIAEARAVSSSPLDFGVGKVDSTGPGSWSSVGHASPLLSSGSSSLAVSEPVGTGTLVLLASAAPLQNRLIGQADNAAFAIDIGMSPAKAVAFDEYDHGYGQTGGGLAGLPSWWKAALLLALAAVILWLLSAARRFGPPEDADRVLPPARVAYVEAMATLLSTAPPERAAGATAAVQIRARDGLCRRIGVPNDATDEEITRVGASTGVPADLVSAVLGTPRTADELVAVGRASAELARERF
jgi:hypothetical protein